MRFEKKKCEKGIFVQFLVALSVSRFSRLNYLGECKERTKGSSSRLIDKGEILTSLMEEIEVSVKIQKQGLLIGISG